MNYQNNTNSTNNTQEIINQPKCKQPIAQKTVTVEKEAPFEQKSLLHLILLSIPKYSTPQNIRNHFNPLGEIVKLKLVQTPSIEGQIAYISLRLKNSSKNIDLNKVNHQFQGSQNILIHKISSKQLKECLSKTKNGQTPSERSRTLTLRNLPSTISKEQIKQVLSPYGLIKTLKFSTRCSEDGTRKALFKMKLPNIETILECMKSTVFERLMKTTLTITNPYNSRTEENKISQFPWLHKSELPNSPDVSIYQHMKLQNKFKRVARRSDRSDRELLTKQFEEDRLYLQKIEQGLSSESESDDDRDDPCRTLMLNNLRYNPITRHSEQQSKTYRENLIPLFPELSKSTTFSTAKRRDKIEINQEVKITVLFKIGALISRRTYRSQKIW